ncbi:MAG: ABC transporter ATP-binding protein [Lachnospiraceae bacterium]|nr:ABC transporter ATP-binding protein [Lachnospiraceae bacterium]
MLIEIKKLNKSYGTAENRHDVLRDLSLKIQEGEICVIFGPSGSGKSTLLNIIGGLDEIDEGSVLVAGRQLEKMTANELAAYRRAELGFVFQFYNLIPDLTVRENIQVCEKLTETPLALGELLRVLELEEQKDYFPAQLSGGQQQRCAIARALIKNPEILLCDEPTGALDYNISKEMLSLLESVNRRFGTAIVIVTHNKAIGAMANHVISIRDGKVSEEYYNENPLPAQELEW